VHFDNPAIKNRNFLSPDAPNIFLLFHTKKQASRLSEKQLACKQQERCG